ncbi:MFS transporter [Epidermidibacterium keratini]|uniref:MFS transporter n=1 Tax=Epidermidibacterium keratini TaxID=1891644 RepID=A0A7L4YQB9_9ACTN|nr:MFS transporter [Epidermidibacterium keratini]QHC00747.1 MFS transporter [Epidermidibacterium keratini]
MSVQSIRRTALPLWIAAVAVLILAANLRVAVNAVGATLPEMRASLGMSGAAAGLLTALPPFCFGVMGLAGPSLARRIGLERTALLSAVVLTIGQLGRAILPGQVWVLAGSTVALAAIALANVVMPSLIRKLFPERMAAMTTAYTAIMTLFAAFTSFVTLPIQSAFGADYRLGLGMWAIVSLLAVLPWLPAIRSNPFGAASPTQPVDDIEAPPPARRIRLAELARVPKAWLLAILFGTQSLQAYIVFGWLTTLLHDTGLSAQAASAQVGVVSLAATVATLFAPAMIGRLRKPATVTWVLTAAYAGGYLGLLIAPTSATVLWSILIGIGQAFFPIGMYLVNLRAKTHEGVLSLSTFMQCIGYVYAGTALFALGTIHGSSTNWSGVIIFVLGLCVIQQACALVGIRHWSIEDELAARDRSSV